MANLKTTEYPSTATTLANGDLIDISKDTVGDGSVFESQKMTQTSLRTTLGVNSTARYLALFDGTKVTTSTIYQAVSGYLGFFGNITPTYDVTFNGDNGPVIIGVERRTGSSSYGNILSLYGGHAATGSTNQNGGDVQITAGNVTGTGSSKITFSTAKGSVSGTTQTFSSGKMQLTGDGWLSVGNVTPTSTFEVFTSTGNSKMRVGHNLATILSTTMAIGVQLARVDGTYVIHSGIYSGSDYNTYITYGNGAIRFVRNPASDTSAGLVLGGGSQAGSIWSGVGNTGTYEFHFRRTWNNGGSAISAYIDATGTNTNSAQSTGGLYINNNIVNSSTGVNYALQINASGHTTTASNIAISVEAGRTVLLGTVANYDLSFGENADRTFGVNRETSSSTAGWKLSIYGGSAVLGGSNLSGGNVEVITGTGTGTGGADIVFKTSTPGSSGTSDNTPTTKMTIKGSGVINMSALPTSSAGLSSGDLWNNSGVVNIV